MNRVRGVPPTSFCCCKKGRNIAPYFVSSDRFFIRVFLIFRCFLMYVFEYIKIKKKTISHLNIIGSNQKFFFLLNDVKSCDKLSIKENYAYNL